MNPNSLFADRPSGEGTPIFDFLERLSKRANGKQLVARFVHSPLAEMLVAATPTPVDDAILALLKQAIPKPA